MKRFYLILVTFLAMTTAWAKTTNWNSTSGGSWASGANWTNGVPDDDDVVTINTGTAITITNVPNVDLSSLTITGNSTVTFTATTGHTIVILDDVTGADFSLTAGSTLTLGANVNLSLDNDDVTATIAGTLIVTNGRTYRSNQTGNLTTVTGTIDNAGTVSGTASRLRFNAGGLYLHSQNGGDVAIATWNTGATCQLTGVTSTYPDNMDQDFANVTFDGNLTSSLEMGQDLNCSGDLTIATTGSNLRLTSSNTNRDVNVGGKFIMTSGFFSIDHDNGGSTLNVAGDFELLGGTLAVDGSDAATVNFTGTAVRTFTKAAAPTAIISGEINFNINGNAKVDFGTSVLNGSTGTFTLSTNGKIITANANGLSTSGSIQVSGTKTFNTNADYEFQGASTGVFNTTTNPQIRNLIVNNSTTSEVVLSKAMTITGSLELNNGYLTTTTNLPTLTTAATAPTSNGAYVNGPLAKNTNSTATTFTFPVGKPDVGIRTIGIRPTTTNSSVFVAEFFRSTPPVGTNGTGITRHSECEYWTLARSSGTSQVRPVLSWGANSNCNDGVSYVTQPNSLRVAYLNGTVWTNLNNASTTGSATAGTITANTTLTNFNVALALASSVTSENPLPVLFDAVQAYGKGNGIQIEWSNLTEREILDYVIERSANGIDFLDITHVTPKSNQNDKASYNYFDAIPLSGSNFYRIRVNEAHGKIIMSKILRVEMGVQSKKGMVIYPNPVVNGQLTIGLSGVKQGQYTLSVVNTAGQYVFSKTIVTQGNSFSQNIDLPSTIKPGVYTVLVNGGDYRENKMIVIK